MTTQEQYVLMHTTLDERQWRVFLATEALKIGRGGISRVNRLSKADRKTIRKGIIELKDPPLQGRVRRVGGGRKKLTEKDTTLIKDLESLVEPKGDPMSLTQWTTKSLAHLSSALAKNNHTIKATALARLLASLDFSLKANKKNIEGVSHPDRDLQFRHIKATCESFEKNGNPIISVDCKKKGVDREFQESWPRMAGKRERHRRERVRLQEPL